MRHDSKSQHVVYARRRSRTAALRSDGISHFAAGDPRRHVIAAIPDMPMLQAITGGCRGGTALAGACPSAWSFDDSSVHHCTQPQADSNLLTRQPLAHAMQG